MLVHELRLFDFHTLEFSLWYNASIPRITYAMKLCLTFLGDAGHLHSTKHDIQRITRDQAHGAPTGRCDDQR